MQKLDISHIQRHKLIKCQLASLSLTATAFTMPKYSGYMCGRYVDSQYIVNQNTYIELYMLWIYDEYIAKV